MNFLPFAPEMATRTELAEQVTGLETQMRVLHEDVIGRIALLHEAWAARSKRTSRKK